eukprot:6192007-Pleurochrysis_carterae.AAC.5
MFTSRNEEQLQWTVQLAEVDDDDNQGTSISVGLLKLLRQPWRAAARVASAVSGDPWWVPTLVKLRGSTLVLGG